MYFKKILSFFIAFTAMAIIAKAQVLNGFVSIVSAPETPKVSVKKTS